MRDARCTMPAMTPAMASIMRIPSPMTISLTVRWRAASAGLEPGLEYSPLGALASTVAAFGVCACDGSMMAVSSFGAQVVRQAILTEMGCRGELIDRHAC